MKYTGYTKKELMEWLRCSEHNYNVEKERADNQFLMLVNMQKKLDIAVKDLEEIKEYSSSYFLKERDVEYTENTMMRMGCIISKFLAKIKEIK